MKKIASTLALAAFVLLASSCASPAYGDDLSSSLILDSLESERPSEEKESSIIEAKSTKASRYIDADGNSAYIPSGFVISSNAYEQYVETGLVVIAPDKSEYVWVPTKSTPFKTRDFGSYYSSGDRFSNYHDEVELDCYKRMESSVEAFGGFYIGRYEASKGANDRPLSVKVSSDNPGTIWVQFSPQDTIYACQSLYADNDSVEAFFPWGVNYDTTLQYLIDSKCKTQEEVASDSTSWGNYSNDAFSVNARGNYTGVYEEAKANNIYDLAGNNWEWTRERCGSNFVMRGGGYNLMGGDCLGSRYPAALRDPLPGNNHHPNVTFRIGLFVL